MSTWAEKPISLADAAGRGMHVECAFESAHLPRLSALVAQSVEDAVGGDAPALGAELAMDFSLHAEPRFIALTGRIEARFGLMCQRCLELTTMALDFPVSLAVVGSGEPGDYLEPVASTFERWDHDGDELALADVVDELVLLELPLVVMHDDREACGKLAGEARFAGQAEKTQKPFAGLSAMLDDKSS